MVLCNWSHGIFYTHVCIMDFLNDSNGKIIKNVIYSSWERNIAGKWGMGWEPLPQSCMIGCVQVYIAICLFIYLFRCLCCWLWKHRSLFLFLSVKFILLCTRDQVINKMKWAHELFLNLELKHTYQKEKEFGAKTYR